MTATDPRIFDALAHAGINYDAENFSPNQSFRGNGIDSLDVMSLFLTLEEKFETKFSESEASAIRTPVDLTAALNKKLE